MRDVTALKKLSVYSKTEIIAALSQLYQCDDMVRQMLECLESQKESELINRHGKAMEKEDEARKAFLLWQKEMCNKYGDGRSVSLKDIPINDIKRGATFEQAWHEALATERRLDKQVSSMLGVGDQKGTHKAEEDR